MKRLRVRLAGGVVAAVFLVSVPAGVAAAASTTGATTAAPAANPNGAFNVVVSPTSQVLDVKPGGTVSTTLQVRNNGLATEHLKITVMKFGANGTNGTPQLLQPTAGDSFVNWAHFSAAQFDAEPNVWTPINVTIAPPKTAALGYYYAIVFSRAQNSASSGHAANLLGAVATLVLLDVQVPSAHPAADITQFSTDHNVYEFLPANFTVQMHNRGNIFLAPRGNIFITKGGKHIATLEVNLAEGNILPNTNRIFTVSWADGTPVYKQQTTNNKVVLDKQGRPQLHLDWGNFSFNKLRFGEYHAQLVMVYNNGSNDISEQANLNFWVIPWRILAAVLAVLLLLLAGLWSLFVRPLRRRLRARRKNAAGPSATPPLPPAGQ